MSGVFIYIFIRTLIVFTVLISCSVQDFKEHKVSNLKIIAGCIAVFICNLWNSTWLVLLFSGFFSFGIYLITKIIMKNKIGWGDVLFALFSGLCIEPVLVILSIIISVFSAAIFIGLRLIRKKELRRIAFIPFMSMGLFICYILSFL